MNFSKDPLQAFSLVEILIAIGIFSIFSLGVVYLSLDTLQRDAKVELRQEALLYAQEGLEAVRNMRDRSYLLLSNGDHGLSFSSDTWSFVAAPESINGFYFRTISIEDVYRDINGDVATAGTYDPETKKITSEVSWQWHSVFPQSVLLTTYLSNWSGNDWIQTTCGEWNSGTFENTESETSTAPPPDNCLLKLSLVEEASDFFVSTDLGEHAVDVVVEGNYAYVATKKSALGFAVVDISDPNNPLIIKELDVGGKGRYLTKQGNTIYMAVENKTKGLAIVDVTTPSSASVIYQLNVGDYGNQPAAFGNTLFMGVEKSNGGFVSVNITNPASPSLLQTLNLNAKVRSVALSSSYAYVGVDDDSTGFRVLNISNPSSITSITSLDVGEEVNAVLLNSGFAFLGTEDSDDSLQVVTLANPEAPSLVNSLDVSGEIQDLGYLDGYVYAAVDNNHAGLAVINITTPSTPTLSYNLDIMGKGTGVDVEGNYVYVTTDVSNRGLVIIGTLVSGVSTSGSYTSTIFDTGGEDTRYNFIEWDHTEVPGGSVHVQIRTADTTSSINSATWVGSDGTSGTYYETPRTEITLDSNRTGLRYFQFKIDLDSDGSTSPPVESLRVNYNP